MNARAPAPPKSRLTRLAIRNFKRFDSVEIELGSPALFVGPNNSGKTSALQALVLWRLGVRRWIEAAAAEERPEQGSGVALDRRDLSAAAVRRAQMLWRDLRVREVQRENGRQRTTDVLIEIEVSGRTGAGDWTCGLEFEYANEESIFCRPLRSPDGSPQTALPDEATGVEVAFLPPMSGLARSETRLDPGTVELRLGEERTAEVLRNVCWHLYEKYPRSWLRVVAAIRDLFGAELDPPTIVEPLGEIEMTYRQQGARLDISDSGRGCQQALLLLAYLSANPGAVLLLDEPDTGLGKLLQRKTYNLLTEMASESGNQIIAVTHSEVLLNETCDRDPVIAFVGRPHRIGRHRDGLRRALGEIEFRDYMLAESHGWVLYLGDSADLATLREFARRLGHEEAQRALEMPFTRYVGRKPKAAQRHFHGLMEASPAVRAIAIFDRPGLPLPLDQYLRLMAWERREIENYFATERCLLAYAEASPTPDSPAHPAPRRAEAMRAAFEKVREGAEILQLPPPWSDDAKASTDVLVPILRHYHSALGQHDDLPEKNLHRLVAYLPDDEIPDEVREKLDAIAETHAAAQASR